MKQRYPLSLSPMTIRGIEFKNRLVMTPSSPGLVDINGFMTRECVDFFRPIAKGGVSVIALGNALVDYDMGHDEERQLRLDTDEMIQPLGKFTDMCHQFGCEPCIELNHTGNDANWQKTGHAPVSASVCVSDFELARAAAEGREPVMTRALTHDEVKDVIEKYIAAAVRCKQAGVRRVIVHGGHANLIGQFSSPYFNHRTDEYGGSLENRARFAIEILDGIRARCGEDFVIVFRISADEMIEGGMHLEETKEYVRLLQDKIDVLNVSAGIRGKIDAMHYWVNPYASPRMANVNYARIFREMLPKSVLVSAVAGIMNIDNAEMILQNGWADIVCMTRPFMADPEMPRKYALGKPETVRPCLRCSFCTARLVARRPTECAVNPVLGRTTEFPAGIIPRAEEKKRVAVVGGGPAGLQALDTLLQRGHSVTLYEASDRLGGNLHNAIGVQPLKQDLKSYLDFIIRRAEASGADIRLNTPATAEELEKNEYDGIILACGAVPVVPPVPGTDLPHVHWAPEADLGTVEPKGRVVIVGAGSVALECAYGLVKKGIVPTIVAMEKDLSSARGGLRGGLSGSITIIGAALKEAGVEYRLDHRLTEIRPDAVVCVSGETGETVEFPADTVLLATGMRSRKDVVNELRGCAPATEVWVVGDAKEPANVANAVHTAFNATVYM
ncbi:MAG: FAD-dependent oxidoreductase [Oscillospiraceae bacterium]|nr:FAD-dependent oxidoreductase [Oscillospiraceae bacterium]